MSNISKPPAQQQPVVGGVGKVAPQLKPAAGLVRPMIGKPAPAPTVGGGGDNSSSNDTTTTSASEGNVKPSAFRLASSVFNQSTPDTNNSNTSTPAEPPQPRFKLKPVASTVLNKPPPQQQQQPSSTATSTNNNVTSTTTTTPTVKPSVNQFNKPPPATNTTTTTTTTPTSPNGNGVAKLPPRPVLLKKVATPLPTPPSSSQSPSQSSPPTTPNKEQPTSSAISPDSNSTPTTTTTVLPTKTLERPKSREEIVTEDLLNSIITETEQPTLAKRASLIIAKDEPVVPVEPVTTTTTATAPVTQQEPSSTSSSSTAIKSNLNTTTKKREWKPTTSASSLQLSLPVDVATSGSSEFSQLTTRNIEGGQVAQPKKETVRVLSYQKGDFTNLNMHRGDIVEITEQGEKDTWTGFNGYKTGNFSIQNTKPMVVSVGTDIQATVDRFEKAVCVKDHRGKQGISLTIMKGDVIAIIDRNNRTTASVALGRVKLGLDGWSDAGEFPLENIRLVSQKEYILYSDLLDLVVEVSERFMDPESLIQGGSEKELEKKQLQLRDKTKLLQSIQDAILIETDEPRLLQLQANLRQEIETTHAMLSNEFYVSNPNNGEIENEESSSPVGLLKDHLQMVGEKKGLKYDKFVNTNREASDSNTRRWDYAQISVDVKLNKSTLKRAGNSGTLEYYFSLLNYTQSKFITEQMQIIPSDTNSSVKFLFKDIEPADLTDDIALVCKVIRRGTMKDHADTTPIKKGSSTDLRRPFGYACIKLISAFSETQIATEKDSNLYFYSSNDLNFNLIPENVLKFNNEEELKKHGVESIPKGMPTAILPIACSFYDMSYEKCLEKYQQLAKAQTIEKMEHKVVKNEKKHHLYISLDSGKFTADKKVEVSVRVRMNDSGEFLHNCISLGGKEFWASEIKSFVCHNSLTPTWNEYLQFQIPEDKFLNCHLLFTIKSASSKQSKTNIIGFAFMRLGSTDSSVAIQNADHNLLIYKASSADVPINYLTENIPSVINSSISSTTGTSSPPLLSSGSTGMSTLNISQQMSPPLNQSQKIDHSSPSSSPQLSSANTGKFSIKKGESLKIKSTFHTTKFIQHPSIHQLLNWKQHEKDLQHILDKFKFVEPLLIMRNLSGIVDSLFQIYESSTAGSLFTVEPMSLLVYNTIVFIIGLLTDERMARYRNFKVDLDQYIETKFSGALTHKHLLNCLAYHMKDISAKESAKISPTLKSLDYMFQLITKSRLVYKQQQSKSSMPGLQLNSINDSEWYKDISEFLSQLNKLMASNSPLLIVVQTLALRNFASMMKGLSYFLDKVTLCKVLCEFIESVHYNEKQEHLNTHKLSVFYQILSAHLAIDQETVEHLLPTLMAITDQHLTKGEELKLSTQLLSLALESLETLDSVDLKKKYFNVIMTVFTKVLGLVDQFLVNDQAHHSHNNSAANQMANWRQDAPFNYDTTFLVTCLLSMLHYMVVFNLTNKYLIDVSVGSDSKLFLKKILRLLDTLLARGVYHYRFPTMQLFHHKITFRLLTLLSPAFVKGNTPIGQENNENWLSFIALHFNFFTTHLMRSNRYRAHRLAPLQPILLDIRVRMVKSVRELWNTSIGASSQFLTHMVQLLLASLLNGFAEVDEMCQDLFFAVMKKDHQEKRSFKRVESKAIEILDKIIIRERWTDEQIFRRFLNQRLDPFFSSAGEEHGDAQYKREGKAFIGNLLQLLSLLFDFRTLPMDRAFEEERTIATLKMMEYFKDRKDTYIKYVHELLSQHINSGYFTEAGFTFLLHADLYSWDVDEEQQASVGAFTFTTPDQPAPITLPAEPAHSRKERLVKMAIQYLDKGQVWEKCITLLQELSAYYDATYNFRGLADVANQQADLYDKIVSTERFFAEYFRVGYYGRKFPQTIQGKEFLYRGFELERLADFTTRILAKFPNAELLKTTGEPSADILNADAQYLLITIVNPSSTEEIHKRVKHVTEGTPSNSRAYHRRNDVNVFLYSKAFEKKSAASPSNPNNKFADLWIRNHFLIADSSFPTIHRRAEVIKKEQTELTPIENAVNSVDLKNEELAEMVKKYLANPQLNLNPLAMALNGSIDAAVNGGVSLYKEAFFEKQDVLDAISKPFIPKLSSALKNQVEILERGLYIHSQRCPEELRGLHEKLESFFPKFKSEVLSL
ncbi:DOCK family protein [Cavenderia fasciculata]|uniref:DOCK family protein n=1 Tax=Cavenderia fasciculata TaxID=261658 RepID=F4Q0L8_CACFS|nr:DOCK family protein [Cavenderia fasciculata]EGG18369.1 DOCK family protein [Cavenderia fasciculata]|eukprot:XP_004366273.1 DOCK family protein [Cavenderia fasciculata]